MATVVEGWFEDPAGRFDGRFFDGQEWTDQVSQDGVAMVDPDWPMAPKQPEGNESDSSIDEAASPIEADDEPVNPERRRGGDRRQVDIFVPVNRRRGDRRQSKPTDDA